MQDYKLIELKNGGVAIVDPEDHAELSKFKWFRSHFGYAYRQGWDVQPDGERKHWCVFLHRVVNKTPEGQFTDHANGNKLDNRKCNLRTCDRSQNSANRPKIKRSQLVSTYKGVSFHRSTGLWRCRVKSSQGDVCTYHKAELQAALDYNFISKKLFGEFAQLNVLPEGIQPTVRKPKSSRFRGVSYHVKSAKWRASLEKAGKGVSLGQYATEEEAARAYNAGALVHFGERARLNEI